jgi:4-diphosphocytidyl-2-C-methyl-D-erythritol kinase
LRTVFQAIGLCDSLSVQEGGTGDEILCDWPGFPPQNTLTKALRFFREYMSLPSLHVELTKRIPALSGLGGGSSDAAGLLRAASLLAPAPLAEKDLVDVARAVGADVPFFLVGGKARAEGYGEVLHPLPDDPPRCVVVARPNVDCPTPEAYAALDRQDYLWRNWPEEELLYNDFERVAPDICKDLVSMMTRFGATGSLLCGSGSAVFGLFSDDRVARRAVARLRSSIAPQAWVTRTLSRAETMRIRTL